MNASFEEKSVWVQLVSLVLGLGAYFWAAGRMMGAGVLALPAYAPLFIVSIVLLVLLMAAGHGAAAYWERPEPRDERDRLITWRAESNSGWLLGAGVIGAIAMLLIGYEAVYVAHVLLLSLLLSEVLGLVLRLSYYHGRV